MKTKYQIRTSKLLLAVGLAPLLPALIHAAHYYHTPFFYWAIPIAAAFSYLITILLLLPAYLILLRHGRFNLKHAALLSGLVGICLGFTLFALNSWGTGGYSYYGEFGYRTVELGKLTLAGYVLASLRIFYFFALALIGGITFYFIAKNKPAESHG